MLARHGCLPENMACTESIELPSVMLDRDSPDSREACWSKVSHYKINKTHVKSESKRQQLLRKNGRKRLAADLTLEKGNASCGKKGSEHATLRGRSIFHRWKMKHLINAKGNSEHAKKRAHGTHHLWKPESENSSGKHLALHCPSLKTGENVAAEEIGEKSAHFKITLDLGALSGWSLADLAQQPAKGNVPAHVRVNMKCKLESGKVCLSTLFTGKIETAAILTWIW